MRLLKIILENLSKKERVVFFVFLGILVASAIGYAFLFAKNRTEIVPVSGGSWREGIVGYPKVVNPVFAETQADRDIATLLFERLDRLMSASKTESNGLVYVATLKQGLFWGDGKPLTSDDIVFTVEEIQNPDSHSPLFKDWQGVQVERVSELQVKFGIPIPYAFFEKNIRELRIIPKHIFGEIEPQMLAVSPYALEPVGSGPYRVRRAVKNKDGIVSSYELVPNNYYAGQKPYIQKFSFSFYDSQEAVERAYRLRSINGFGSASPLLEPDPRGVAETIPMNRYYAVFFNLRGENPHMRNPDFRQALDRAVPKREIIESVFGGRAEEISGPVLGKEVTGEYNAETAKELMQKSGAKNPSFTLTVPKTPFLEKTADILKRYWESAGVKEVKIEVLDPKDVVEGKIRTGEYDALLFGNILENREDLFSFWHSSQREYPGLNLSGFSNGNVDGLLEAIRETTDSETRHAQLDSVDLFVKNGSPAAFLYSVPYLYMHEGRLAGFSVDHGTISNPAERFENVGSWYVEKARIVR